MNARTSRGLCRKALWPARPSRAPLHNWVIGLDNGEAVSPDQGTARTLSLRVVDGDIFIHLPELVAGVAV